MPTPPRVNPGDLISSELMNFILGKIVEYENRLGALEASRPTTAGPLLLSRDPAGDVTVGSRLTLRGQNFIEPANQNIVTIQNVTINQFLPESDSSNLVFAIPNSFNGLPMDANITVSNRFGISNFITVRLLPLIIRPAGEVIFSDITGNIGNIVAGSSYNFVVSIDSQTNVPELYALSVSYALVNGSTAAAWQNATTLEPSGVQQIARGQPLTVRARVTVPQRANNAQLVLQARSLNNDAELTKSFVIPISVGQAPEPNDPRTTLTLDDRLGLFVPNIRNALITVGGLTLNGAEIAYGQTTTVTARAHFSESGRYRYQAEVENPDGLWSVLQTSPTITSEERDSEQIVLVNVQCLANGPASELRFLKIYARRRNADDTADEFSSFLRIPIRGY